MNSKVARSLSFLTAILMLVLVLQFNVFALSGYENPPVWDGSIAESYAGGDGSQENPFCISNGSELALLAKRVSERTAPTGAYYKLTRNIVLNDTSDWEEWGSVTNDNGTETPTDDEVIAPDNSWTRIGDKEHKFCGTFDGAGHTVSGLFINRRSDKTYVDDMHGLFGCIENTTIENLILNESYVYARATVGGIAAVASNSTFSKCHNYSTISAYRMCAGGIVAEISGDISECTNSGKIIGSDKYSYQVGGIVGNGLTCSIRACTNSGDVSGRGMVGGIAGVATKISYCSNSGAVIGYIEAAGDIGGIIGTCANLCSVNDCYNTGNVKGCVSVGGVAGTDTGAIANCYNVGNVSGTQDVGGVVGTFEMAGFTGEATHCYYLDTCCTDTSLMGITPLTDEQMQAEASFDGFRFGTVWIMNTDTEYPYPELYLHFEVKFINGVTGETIHTLAAKAGETLKETDFPSPPPVPGREFIHWTYRNTPIWNDTVITARYKDPNGTILSGYITFAVEEKSNIYGTFADYDPETIEEDREMPAVYAAAFAGGEVYGYHHDGDDHRFFRMNPETHEIISYPGYNPKIGVIAMAYDNIGKVMYAIVESGEENALYNVDLYDGSLKWVADIKTDGEGIVTLAIDGAGNAYGLSSSDTNAPLWKINLKNGKCKKVFDTGLALKSIQSMTYDLKTNRLFWAQFSSDNDNGLYVIDPAEKTISACFGKINYGAEVTGLYAINDDSQIPDAEQPKYKVTFADSITNTQVLDNPLIVTSGYVLQSEDFPKTPAHDGYLFMGWEYNNEEIYEDTTIWTKYIRFGSEDTLLNSFIADNNDGVHKNIWGAFSNTVSETIYYNAAMPEVSAAAYANGEVYGYLADKTFFTMDAKTYEVTYGNKTDKEVFAMAYDSVHEQMYALCPGGDWKQTALFKVNIETGNCEIVGNITDADPKYNLIKTLAIDANGNAYGLLGISGLEALINIDLTTAKCTKIGKINVSVPSKPKNGYCAITIDNATGTLFYAKSKSNVDPEGGLYTIDTATAEVIRCGKIGNGAKITCLWAGEKEPTPPPVIPSEEPHEPTVDDTILDVRNNGEEYTAYPGSVLPVQVKISGEYSVNALYFMLNFDPEKLAVEHIEKVKVLNSADEIGAHTVLDYETFPGSIRLAVATDCSEQLNIQGNIYTVYFTVAKGAQIGEQIPLNLVVREFARNGENSPCFTYDGVIAVTEATPTVTPTAAPTTVPTAAPTAAPTTDFPIIPTPKPQDPPSTGSIGLVYAGIAAILAAVGTVLLCRKKNGKNIIKKTTSFILCLAMLAAFAPTFVSAAGESEAAAMPKAEKEKEIDELLAFSDKLAEITKRYTAESIAKNSDEEYSNDGSTEAGKEIPDGIFELARLIVKSENELDYTGSVAHVNGYDNLHIIQYATPKAARKALEKYQMTEGVEYAVPDTVMSIEQEPHENEFLSWGFEQEHVNAFNYAQWLLEEKDDDINNLPEIVVGVIDTGIDFDHPYFQGRIKDGGHDFANNDENAQDDQGHGSHVSGTICDGTLPNVKILPIKVMDERGHGNTSNIMLGMKYAYEKGCSVVNMSIGGPAYNGAVDAELQEIVNQGMDSSAKTVYCVAAGNEHTDAQNNSPANIPRAFTVAAHDSNRNLAVSFSNYGDVVDITAPGVKIKSVRLGGGYTELDGTSMATPHVSAVCALVRSYYPNMPADDVIDAVKHNAAETIFPEGKSGGAGLLCAGDMFKFDPFLNGEGTYLHYTSDGEYTWHADETGVWSGNAGIADSESTLQSVSTFKAYTELSFEYKVSSEKEHDMLRFTVDDETALNVSGSDDDNWQTFIYEFPVSGIKTLRWTFTKDEDGNTGEDRATIRNIQIKNTIKSTLNSGKAEFCYSGDWIIDGDSARSGNSGKNDSASILTTAPVKTVPGVAVMFDYKVSCGNGDRFQFLINNKTVLDVDNETDWTRFYYVFHNEDEVVFTFRYIKDSIGAVGSDCAWIRKVDFDYTLDTALNASGGNLQFNTCAPYPWIVKEDYVKNGNQFFNGTVSVLHLNCSLKKGDTLEFSYRVGSEAYCDWFSFIVNDVTMLHESGKLPWKTYTFIAPQDGDFEFKWQFSKDMAVEDNGDFAYIDDVRLTTINLLNGDCDCDGDVDANDVDLAMMYAMGLIDEIRSFDAADMDGNGIVNITDASEILCIVNEAE